MKELWTLLISAQKADKGIPPQLLDAKAEEVRKKKVEFVLAHAMVCGQDSISLS